MLVIGHDHQGLSEHLQVHELVELRGNLLVVLDHDGHGVHRLQAEVHQFWLFVLHGEDKDVDHVLEYVLVQAEQATSAVLHNIHHK